MACEYRDLPVAGPALHVPFFRVIIGAFVGVAGLGITLIVDEASVMEAGAITVRLKNRFYIPILSVMR